MPVTHDYRCSAHGPYEGTSDRCPHCGHNRFVKMEFNKAPAFKSARTKNSDRVVKQLAIDYGMSDVKNDKAGGSVMDAMRRGPSSAATIAPSQVMETLRRNPTRTSAWMGSPAPGAFGFGGENALKQVPLSRPSPRYVARDPGEYRKS